MSIPPYPTAEYPTIIDGYVSGPQLRIESLTGGEIYLKASDLGNSFPGSPFAGVEHDGDGFVLKNAGPFTFMGSTVKTWGISHQQKASRAGWLYVSPQCFHSWAFLRLQKQNAEGRWLPGTEVGLYVRKPFSWRWDVPGTMIDGVLRHWIWTKGFIGGHWD